MAPPTLDESMRAPPECMLCCRMGDGGRRAPAKKAKPRRRTRAKSRELRAGILYVNCDCEKRNGLQDDCRRTGCQGSPECLTKPDPICGPSEFAGGKHMGRKSAHEAENGAPDAEGRLTYEYFCVPAILLPGDKTAKVDTAALPKL